MKALIQVVDCATKELVDAELFDEVTIEHFLETQTAWRPLVIEAAARMLQSGAAAESIPRHFHWDWTTKESDLRLLTFAFFGIACHGRLQGLMKLDVAGRSASLASQKGKPLVYVDYLETAP